jgi:hypothetical protein
MAHAVRLARVLRYTQDKNAERLVFSRRLGSACDKNATYKLALTISYNSLAFRGIPGEKLNKSFNYLKHHSFRHKMANIFATVLLTPNPGKMERVSR